MVLSELPLMGRLGELVSGDLEARIIQRHLEVPESVVEWAHKAGIATGGQLLAALETVPGQAAQAWGWSLPEVAQATERLRLLFARW